MKKMNKMYEAPVAEMIEMQMPTVLMVSTGNQGGTSMTSNPSSSSSTPMGWS